MFRSLLIILISFQCTLALGVAPGQIKNFVTFGDSYTDLSGDSDDGTLWPYYVAGYGNYSLYSVAHSGAVCSNALTPRSDPDIVVNEIPEYLSANGSFRHAASETMFSIWIGTNDLGVLTLNAQTPGVTYRNSTKCAVDWVKTLYDHGARNFMFMNILPLNHSPSYNTNSTAVAWMSETVANANKYAAELLAAYAAELPDTHIALFDTHRIFQDIIDNPYSGALNGTDPPNITQDVSAVCPDCTSDERDSWMWIYGMHPTEQMDRLVAQWMNLALNGTGNTRITTWFR